METIRLEGGPMHGRTYDLNGGDVIKLEFAPAVSTLQAIPECFRPKSEAAKLERHIYHRASVDRSIFSYQGMERR